MIVARTGTLALICVLAAVWMPHGSAAAAEAEYLVWRATEDGYETTWIRDAGDSVQTLGRLTHPVLTAGGGLWAWRLTEVTVPSCECTTENKLAVDLTSRRCPAIEAGQGLELVELISGDVLEVVGAPQDAVLGGATQQVFVVGAAGGHLFLQVDLIIEGCEGNPQTASRAVAWDLALRQPEDLLPVQERGEVAVRERVVATRALQASGDIVDKQSGGELALSMIVPRYTPGGLSVEYQYTVPVAAVFADGLWSSSTRSVRKPAQSLPARFTPHVELPAAVGAFVARWDTGAEFGFTTVAPAADAEVAEAALNSFRQAAALAGEDDGGRPADEHSGFYESEFGYLAVMETSDKLRATYNTIFRFDAAAPYECECALTGAADRVDGFLLGYVLSDGGTRFDFADRRVHLGGSPLECCSAGWTRDELRRVGDLPRCTVTAKTAKFYEDDLKSTSSAFAMEGDLVDVLPPWSGLDSQYIFARYMGTISQATGYVRRDALRCPEGVLDR